MYALSPRLLALAASCLVVACGRDVLAPVRYTEHDLLGIESFADRAACVVVDNSATDDTETLQAALDQGGSLCLSGTYQITRHLDIRHSGIGIFGDSSALVVQQTPYTDIFVARERGGPILNLTIDGVRFEGREYPPSGSEPRDAPQAHVLEIFMTNGLVFTNNTATNLGLVYLGESRDDEWLRDGTTVLSRNVVIGGNRATGRSLGYSKNEAIWLGYVRDVHLYGNQLRGYLSGITWWGGDSSPANVRSRRPDDPLYARNWLIEGNDVRLVQIGIWGSMGDSITVTNGNHVENCQDVCLDAEGSDNVIFEKSNAFYAQHGPIAVFFSSRNVTFRELTVKQDDRVWNRGERTDRLLATSTSYDGTTIHIHDVQFIYEATETGQGVGRITKAGSERFDFVGNRLHDTVIDLSSDQNGAVNVSDNTIALTRSTQGRPAIFTSHNVGRHAETAFLAAGPWNVYVHGNEIVSEVPQAAAGIRVVQPKGTVDSWVGGNRIQGFNSAVSVSPFSQRFRIEANVTAGTIDPDSSREGVEVVGNSLPEAG